LTSLVGSEGLLSRDSPAQDEGVNVMCPCNTHKEQVLGAL